MVDEQTVHNEHLKASKWLLFGAWAIEIIAASIGLFLALSRLDQFSTANIQGALPFFAVAIIELTKIPLAYVLYTTKAVLYRILFSISLILAMGITFETFFIGFESYQSAITKELRPTLTKIAEQKMIIRSSETDTDAADKILDGKSEALANNKENVQAINQKYDREVNSLKEQIQGILAKYESQIAPLKNQEKNIKGRIDSVEKENRAKIAQITKDLQKELDRDSKSSGKREQLINQRIKELEIQKSNIRNNTIKEKEQIQETYRLGKESCILFGCQKVEETRDRQLKEADDREDRKIAVIDSNIREATKKLSSGESQLSIRERYEDLERKQNQKYENQIRSLQQNLNKILKKIELVQGGIRASDKSRISEIENSIAKAEKARKSELKEEKNRFSSQQKSFDGQQLSAAAAAVAVTEANKNLLPLCTSLNSEVADNQVYRLALQIFGSDDACSLTEEQLSITKAIWFGSLALIVSVLGTILAIASFVLKNPPYRDESRSLSRRLRYLFVMFRRRLFKPRIVKVNVEVERKVEVVKEIPVEKVAIHEVPKEIIKREVVHIPVYTNDPTLLGDSKKPTDETSTKSS